MPITLDLSSDGVPKRQIVESAFGRLGMAGYEFGRTAEEVNTALVALNSLMGEWPFSAITTYERPAYGTGSAEEASGIGPQDVAGVVAQLALHLAPEFGVTFSKEATVLLGRSVALLRSRYVTIPAMPYASGTPIGAGARGRGPFIVDPDGAASETSADDPGDLAELL